MLVRWLGAFAKASTSLETSLTWELSRESGEYCAEPIRRHEGSSIHQSRVGLLVKNSALVKIFSGDVWSIPRKNGRLLRTNDDPNMSHREAFVKPNYIAIVLKDVRNITRSAKRTVRQVSAEHGIPVLFLDKNGKLQDWA